MVLRRDGDSRSIPNRYDIMGNLSVGNCRTYDTTCRPSPPSISYFSCTSEVLLLLVMFPCGARSIVFEYRELQHRGKYVLYITTGNCCMHSLVLVLVASLLLLVRSIHPFMCTYMYYYVPVSLTSKRFIYGLRCLFILLERRDGSDRSIFRISLVNIKVLL